MGVSDHHAASNAFDELQDGASSTHAMLVELWCGTEFSNVGECGRLIDVEYGPMPNAATDWLAPLGEFTHYRKQLGMKLTDILQPRLAYI